MSITLGVALVASSSVLAVASPLITLPEVESLFPDYVNHEQMNGFQAPCVDANGKLTINADVSDILAGVTEPIAVAMVCQQIGLPPFTPIGPVTFSDPGMTLLSLSGVPGHEDAFAIEFIVPLGVNSFTICIENTGWPEGCLNDLVDFAAWDLVSVSAPATSFGAIKALY